MDDAHQRRQSAPQQQQRQQPSQQQQQQGRRSPPAESRSLPRGTPVAMADPPADHEETLSEMGDAVHDAALFEHNRRFQAAVLRTMENQMSRMDAAVEAKDRQLSNSESVREDLAIGFADMKKELARMNKNHQKTTAELRNSTHSHATLQNENLHLKSELQAAQKQTATLQAELSRMRIDLSASRDELHAGKQLHQVFSSDLTMHRQLKENMSAEVRQLQSELKKAQAGGEEQHARWEKKEAECVSLRNELTAQGKQTQLAQAELERVVNELALLRASGDVMTRQWEGALTAMHKRDQTMSTVAAKKNAAESEVMALRNAEQSLTQEVMTLRASSADLQTKLQESQQRNMDLQRAHDDLKRAHTDLSRNADELVEEKQSAEGGAAAILKQNALLQSENQRLSLRMHQLRDDAALLKSQLLDAQELNRSIDRSIASTENSSVARTEGLNAELSRKVVSLDHDRQLEVNKSIELVAQVKELSRLNAMLNDEHAATCGKLHSMASDLKAAHSSLEHMTYRANKAESEAAMLRTSKEEERRTEARALEFSIRSLETELKNKQSEVAHMNHAFVVAEEKCLEAHRIHSDIAAKTEKLKGELRKTEGVKDRLRAQVESMTTEKEKVLNENNEHRLALRKQHSTVLALSNENSSVKAALVEAQHLLSAQTESHAAELAAARAESLRSRDKKSLTLGVLEISEREKGVWERKHESLLMKYNTQKAELDKMSSLYFAQQKAFNQLQKEQSLQEKQYAAWMKSFENMCDRQGGGKKVGASPSAAGSSAKLTFSANQTMSAKQVLENFAQVSASLPANSASFASNAPVGSPLRAARGTGASIMASGGSAGSHGGSGSVPALDSLNDMMAAMSRSGTHPHAQPSGGGSASARTMADSDSRASTFHEGLVQELRAALHKSSTAAAERLNELTKLRADMKALLIEQNACATREHDLLQRVHMLSTQQQSMNTNVQLAQKAYARAEAMCASLEKQLREAHRALLSAPSSADSEHKDAIRSIDYQFYSDMEPSPLLRSILNASGPAAGQRASGSGGAQSSMQSLSAYTGSTAALHSSPEEAKSLQQHGRAARVGLGRPQRKGDELSSSGSLGPQLTSGHSAIASTVSMLSSNASSAGFASPPSRSMAASAAVLPQRAAQSPMTSASSTALDAQRTSSPHASFSALPIQVRPSGRTPGHGQ